MKTREEKIIEILSKIDSKLNEWEGHSGIFFNDDRVRIGRARLIYFIKSFIADAILALPLDVPSDKKIDDEAFSIRYRKKNEFDAMCAYAFIYGADWMRNEIIKRNTKK